MRIRFLSFMVISCAIFAVLVSGCTTSISRSLDSETIYSATENNTIRSIGWSPNSNTLAFTTLRPTTGEVQIYLLDLATQDLQILSEDYFIFKTWSANGENIVALSTQSNDLWIIPLDTPNQPERLGSGQFASWASDNNFLAISNRKTLRVYHLEGRTEKVIVSFESEDRHSSISYPSWSPDANKLAFLWDEDTTDGKNEVYTYDIDVDGSIVLETIGLNHRPTWSSDGKFIAYLQSTGFSNNLSIIIYDIESGCKASIPLIKDTTYISWSPDGKMIAMVGSQSIEIIDSSKVLETVYDRCR